MIKWDGNNKGDIAIERLDKLRTYRDGLQKIWHLLHEIHPLLTKDVKSSEADNTKLSEDYGKLLMQVEACGEGVDEILIECSSVILKKI